MSDVGVEGRMRIDVWSDVMCPFCYMGDTLLARALEQFPHGAQIDVRYRSYQLMPHLPRGVSSDVHELLVREKGISRAHAESMNAQVTSRGREVGLDYRFDRALAVNTRDAHRLSHFAADHGRQHTLMVRLFRGYFTEGLDLGDHEVLADLAAEAGLDRAAALDALGTGAYEEEVAEDEREGRELGVRGVPFFVLDGRYAVSGAQSVATFVGALETAWGSREGR